MFKAVSFAAPLAGLLALAFSGLAAAAPQYTITPLVLPVSGKPASALAVNDLGEIAVRGTAQDLGAPGSVISIGVPAGQPGVTIRDFSNNGVAVGNAGQNPIAWQGGQFRALAPLDGPSLGGFDAANAVNEQGVIVGDFNARAVVWRGDSVQALGGLAGENRGSATGINESGTIVGISLDRNFRAVLWENGQVMQLRGGDDGAAKTAGINDAGAVVGAVWINGVSLAARWDDRQLTVLGLPEGASSSDTFAINNQGLIVGQANVEGMTRAALWEGSTALLLNDLLINGSGWNLTQAFDINDAGQIVGWGDFGGKTGVPFMLTPVPEPSTGACFTLGAILVTASMGRRRQGQA